MTEYAVTCATKNAQGDVVSIGGSWGSYEKATAIYYIQIGLHSFYVPLTNGSVAQIEVVNGPTGPYLRTNWDGTTKNNLDDLKMC
ncbi:DUF3892 domain-containing protein [Microbacterium algihabitans]|uniref:DUF3892 domain-containing protein n=1 Tax=Microbacterium algihabitans TaxID=3075992 RepID=UPI003461553E